MNLYSLLFSIILFIGLVSYLITFRLFVTIVAIIFITPQIPVTYYNVVVDIMFSTGVFAHYGEAKRFVFIFTWVCIFLYCLLHCLPIA